MTPGQAEGCGRLPAGLEFMRGSYGPGRFGLGVLLLALLAACTPGSGTRNGDGPRPVVAGAATAPSSARCSADPRASRDRYRDVMALHDAIATSADRPPDRFVRRVEQEVLRLTNRMRRQNGLSELKEDPRLSDVARFHSRDMLRRGFFSHESPERIGPFDRMGIGHRRFIGLGAENLFLMDDIFTRDATALASRAVDGWRDSAGHWSNMSNPDHTHIGIGVESRDGCHRLTQLFGTTIAYLQRDLPLRVSDGSRLAMRLAGRQDRGVEYGLARQGGKELEFGPYPIGDRRLTLGPGTYDTRFLFPQGNQYLIYGGPTVIVGRN